MLPRHSRLPRHIRPPRTTRPIPELILLLLAHTRPPPSLLSILDVLRCAPLRTAGLSTDHAGFLDEERRWLAGV